MDECKPLPGGGGGRPGPDACFASLRFAVLCAGYVPSPLPIRVASVRPIDGARVAAPRALLVIAGSADDAVAPAATWQMTAWFDDAAKHAHRQSHVFPAGAYTVPISAQLKFACPPYNPA